MTQRSPNAGNSRDADKFVLRLPDGMRDHLKASASAAGHSTNTHIVRILSDAITRSSSAQSDGSKRQWNPSEGDLVQHEVYGVGVIRWFEFVSQGTIAAITLFQNGQDRQRAVQVYPVNELSPLLINLY